MERIQILIKSVEEVLNFNMITEKLDAGVYLIDGSRVIDAKSLLGIFSLGIGVPYTLEIRGEEESRVAAISALNQFIAP